MSRQLDFTVCKGIYIGLFLSKSKNRMTKSVDSDETAGYEPSHQDLHCLQRYLYWSVSV